jgi:gamma-glutamyltranspeptidase/glutathione hydrolase
MRAAVLQTGTARLVPNSGGTSCVLIADGEGNAVNVVQSVFHPFGGAVLDPETGILFNNRMLGFTHVPGQVNSVGPNKRPAHTLCPIMVSRNHKLRYVLASPGGLSQTLTNTQVLTHLIDCGRDVAGATSEPRWCNTTSGEFLVESGFPESVVAELARFGHRVERRKDPYFYGSAKAIEVLPSGGLAGAADHRREAFAAGY